LTEDRLRLIRRVNEFCSAETIVSNRLWEVLKWMPLGLCKVPGLTGFKRYCCDVVQSSISTNLIVGQACVFIASCSINEEV